MTRHPTADECARFVIAIAERRTGLFANRIIDWWDALSNSTRERFIAEVHLARAARAGA